ncbi:MAG: hypothetical protein ACOH5I_14870 [Oligoflexus sp.]
MSQFVTKRRLSSFTLVLFAFLGLIPHLYAGKLNTIKQDLHKNKENEATSEHPQSEKIVRVQRNNLEEEESPDPELARLVFYGIIYGTYYIFIGPDDESGEAYQNSWDLEEKPYFSGYRGRRHSIRSTSQISLFRDSRQVEASRFSTEFSPAPKWGLRVDYDKFEEKLDVGTDHLGIARASVIFNRIRTQKLAFQWIFGGTWIDGNGAFHWGGRVKYYAFRPISLQAQYLSSTHDPRFQEWDLVLGLHWQRWEARVGFQRLKFGQTNLEGPVFGLAVHF